MDVSRREEINWVKILIGEKKKAKLLVSKMIWWLLLCVTFYMLVVYKWLAPAYSVRFHLHLIRLTGSTSESLAQFC